MKQERSLMQEARLCMDIIIDESLDCQDNILNNNITGVIDFGRSLKTIFDLRNKVSDALFKVLESQITSLKQTVRPIATNNAQSEQLLECLSIGLIN